MTSGSAREVTALAKSYKAWSAIRNGASAAFGDDVRTMFEHTSELIATAALAAQAAWLAPADPPVWEIGIPAVDPKCMRDAAKMLECGTSRGPDGSLVLDAVMLGPLELTAAPYGTLLNASLTAPEEAKWCLERAVEAYRVAAASTDQDTFASCAWMAAQRLRALANRLEGSLCRNREA